eukprot:4673110-Pleurochrysis_carterae.AAC.2
MVVEVQDAEAKTEAALRCAAPAVKTLEPVYEKAGATPAWGAAEKQTSARTAEASARAAKASARAAEALERAAEACGRVAEACGRVAEADPSELWIAPFLVFRAKMAAAQLLCGGRPSLDYSAQLRVSRRLPRM